MTLPFTERCVLLTGAGGSIGAALAKEILQHNPRALLLLDHSEGNLHQIQFELSRILPAAVTAAPFWGTLLIAPCLRNFSRKNGLKS